MPDPKGRIVTPATVDISQIVSDSLRHGERQVALENTLDAKEGGYDASVNSEVKAIQDEGQLAHDAKLLIDSLTVQKEQRNRGAAAAFGVNMEASNSVIDEMSKNILEQHKELRKEGQGLIGMQNVGFSDDPVEWFFNQFKIPQAQAAYNTREAVLDREAKTLLTLQNLTQEQVKVNNATAETTNARLSAIQAEQLLKTATIRAENARQEAAKFGVSIISVRNAISYQQFETMLQVHTAQVQLQKLELDQAHKALAEQDLELRRKNLQLLIDKKEEDAKARAELQSNLDRATAVLGSRRISPDEYERAPQQIKGALFDVMMNPNTDKGRLGSDTVDALNNAARLNAPLTPSLNVTRDILLTEATKIQGKRPDWSALKDDQKQNILNKGLKEYVAGEVNNIPDKGGIYSAPPLASLRGIPAVTSTILWKSVLSPQSNNPMRETSAQSIFDAAAGLIADKKISIEKASAEISQIYKAITLDNTQNRDYNRFALPLQNDYHTAITIGQSSVLGGKKIIDMTNQTEVLNAMMRATTELRLEKQGVYNTLERSGSAPGGRGFGE
jgi:hypothetical protein